MATATEARAAAVVVGVTRHATERLGQRDVLYARLSYAETVALIREDVLQALEAGRVSRPSRRRPGGARYRIARSQCGVRAYVLAVEHVGAVSHFTVCTVLSGGAVW